MRRYAAGGPLRRLAASGATRATLCATAEGGWLAGALEELRRFSTAEVATGLAPELMGGTADAADAAAATAADAATLHELRELGELLRRLQAQGRSLAQGGSWLHSWRPLLVPQHGALAASAVLVDSAGTLWLTDLSRAPNAAAATSSSAASPSAFEDAAALLGSLLFDSQPCSDERAAEQAYGVIDALIDGQGLRELWQAPAKGWLLQRTTTLIANTTVPVGGAGTVVTGRPKRRRWFAGDSEDAISANRACVGSDSDDGEDEDRPKGELIGTLRPDGMVVAPDGEIVGRRKDNGAIVDETTDASLRGARPHDQPKSNHTRLRGERGERAGRASGAGARTAALYAPTPPRLHASTPPRLHASTPSRLHAITPPSVRHASVTHPSLTPPTHPPSAPSASQH